MSHTPYDLPQWLVSRRDALCVILITLLLNVWLGTAVWDMNFWPTDTKAYFFEAALRLPQLNYLSEIHDALDARHVRWLHGKEVFILLASWAQRGLGDTLTIRPFLLVDLLAVSGSAILIFLIACRLWGRAPAWLAFILFSTSFWPYQYVLFAKHQPVGLLFVLSAMFFVIITRGGGWSRVWLFLSGLCLGGAMFSSTVSALYLPYYIVLFFYWHRPSQQGSETGPKRALNFTLSAALVAGGGLLAVAAVGYPDVVNNVLRFWEYVGISRDYNHFYYNQPVLQQWLHDPGAQTRGGWLWVMRYFRISMPAVFPLCAAAFVFLLADAWRRRWNRVRRMAGVAGIGLLSFAPPILAEIKQVAQYGSNYFPVFLGCLFLLAYAFDGFQKRYWPILKSRKLHLNAAWTGGIILLTHVLFNAYIFCSDVYPTRMATTFLSEFLHARNTSVIYTYPRHPHRSFMVDYISPDVRRQIDIKPMDHIYQPKEGILLIPPATGDSIYIAAVSDYTNFDQDIYLNELFKRGVIHRYALASFKTLASSAVWLYEEEILSYRALILGHSLPASDPLTRVWVLDAGLLRRDLKRNLPERAVFERLANGVRNIGTQDRWSLFRGRRWIAPQPFLLEQIPVRLSRVGEPTDALRAYVFSASPQSPAWTPAAEHYASVPLGSGAITKSSDGDIKHLRFDPPLTLPPGLYWFVLYRTGAPDNRNFYRVQAPEIPADPDFFREIR